VIDDPEDDRSLARERTVLAWQRTGLAYLGTGLLLLRALPNDVIGHRTLLGAGLIVTGVAAVAFGFVQRRVTGPPAFRIISLAMTLLAAAALVASVAPA
jgi:uncharacterized membrane protein YidH (DUF202 family)